MTLCIHAGVPLLPAVSDKMAERKQLWCSPSAKAVIQVMPAGVTFIEVDAPALRLDTHFPLSAMGRCGFRPGNRGVCDVASLPPWFAVSCCWYSWASTAYFLNGLNCARTFLYTPSTCCKASTASRLARCLMPALHVCLVLVTASGNAFTLHLLHIKTRR